MSIKAYPVIGKPIGLDNVCYAVIEKDDETGTEYREVKTMARAIAMTITPELSEGTLDSNDAVEESEATISKISVSFNASAIEDAVRAEILGHRMDANGGIVDSADDKAPNIALFFRAKLSGRAGYKYVVLYKGTFKEFAETFNTEKQGEKAYQTPTIEGSFFRRISDGLLRYSVRSDTKGVSADTISKWFDSVPEPAEGDYAGEQPASEQ